MVGRWSGGDEETALRRFWMSLTLCLALAACGGGGPGGGGGGGDNTPTTADLSGVALASNGALASTQSPLASATVQVFDLAGGAVVATASTDATGAYLCSAVLGNAVPLNRTLRVVVQTGTQVVSGVVNSSGTSLTKHLDDVTHVAALAMLAAGGTTFTDAQILLFEQAARARLEGELAGDPTVRFALLSNQPAAAALAAAVAADVAGGLVANALPQVGSIVTSPTQFVVQGGTVDVTVTAADADGLAVWALVLRPGAAVAEAVALAAAGGTFTGSFVVGDNGTTLLQRTTVYIVVDDGRHAPVPQSIRAILVRPEGTFLLDILTETLFDEPASRAPADGLFDRLRPIYHRGDGRARRQVNPNQTIRGATCTVVDNTSFTGVTGNDGLLLLEVPLSLLNDRQIAIDAQIAGRVPYRQVLILPPDLAPLAGDRIEVDLVLATQAQWQSVATDTGLGTLNFGLVPLSAFFNVRNDVSLTGQVPGAQSFRPISSTVRADDGDFLFSNLPAGALTVSGTFTDPVDAVAADPFGPVEVDLVAGSVHAFAALLPPD